MALYWKWPICLEDDTYMPCQSTLVPWKQTKASVTFLSVAKLTLLHYENVNGIGYLVISLLDDYPNSRSHWGKKILYIGHRMKFLSILKLLLHFIAAMLSIGKRAISIITKYHVTFTEAQKTRYSPSKFGSNY